MLDGREIAICNNKFISNGVKENKGAINLVMHLDGLDYKAALRLIIDYFDKESVAAENSATLLVQSTDAVNNIAKQFLHPPSENPHSWPVVRNWMKTICGVPTKLVERLHKFGLVFADKCGNAVFPRNGGGAHVHGTGLNQFERIYGRQTAGIFAIQGKATEAGIYLVENPLNAIAIKAMSPDAVAIATSEELLSSEKLKDILGQPSLQSVRIFAAFDNGKIGQKMARKASRLFNSLRHAPPIKFHSWAQALKEDQSLISKLWLDVGFDNLKGNSAKSSLMPENLSPGTKPKI